MMGQDKKKGEWKIGIRPPEQRENKESGYGVA